MYDARSGAAIDGVSVASDFSDRAAIDDYHDASNEINVRQDQDYSGTDDGTSYDGTGDDGTNDSGAKDDGGTDDGGTKDDGTG